MEKSAVRFVWHYIKIFKWIFMTMVALLLIGQLCRQFVPYYLSRLYDAVSTFAGTPQAWHTVLLCIFLAFVLQLFLIFDEATSALDSENEKHIQASLSRLMKGKTVIAVAHRLSTLREMDRILVFHKGRIVEEGSHEQLLRLGGRYAKLFKMQSDGFIG